ncbi:hypothetical protein E2C01_019129 [Portunus trituberculatus]|uniref:Uncharacterized protein n=1 Tax=Portunus trituberculatus TaxID=210409 RepID=A0A5B7DYE8_PORTR|nr:hypothetical protein [Portunus trituberculatus]
MGNHSRFDVGRRVATAAGAHPVSPPLTRLLHRAAVVANYTVLTAWKSEAREEERQQEEEREEEEEEEEEERDACLWESK